MRKSFFGDKIEFHYSWLSSQSSQTMSASISDMDKKMIVCVLVHCNRCSFKENEDRIHALNFEFISSKSFLEIGRMLTCVDSINGLLEDSLKDPFNDLCTQLIRTIVTHMDGKSSQEICELFGFPEDSTDEEVAKLKRECGIFFGIEVD
jgi:hypothetical protein